jgi:hypothetical protein
MEIWQWWKQQRRGRWKFSANWNFSIACVLMSLRVVLRKNGTFLKPLHVKKIKTMSAASAESELPRPIYRHQND